MKKKSKHTLNLLEWNNFYFYRSNYEIEKFEMWFVLRKCFQAGFQHLLQMEIFLRWVK